MIVIFTFRMQISYFLVGIVGQRATVRQSDRSCYVRGSVVMIDFFSFQTNHCGFKVRVSKYVNKFWKYTKCTLELFIWNLVVGNLY